MSTYEELHGKRVEVFSSDPTLDSSYEGQVWYNSTSGVLKSVVLTEATHSGPAMLNKKSLYGGGVGTSTAGLTVGGIDDSTYLNVVEEWNGSGWAAGGNYPTYRYSAGTAGTQTAAMAYCGRVPGSPGGPTETYEYDGSSWTSGNSFPTPGNSMQGIGSVDTAVVSTEVYTSTNMHHWNGTSWTSANARNTAKGGQAAFGSQTAAVLAGGFPSDSNITELYNGTNWTSGNTMNTGRQQVAGSGTQTSGVAFGGDRPPSEAAQTTIESWDGTSWATSPATLATARTRAGTGRNTASGTWIAGGIGPGGGGEGFDATEIYEKSTNVITAAAWATGGSLTAGARRGVASGKNSQTLTAGLVFGGGGSPYSGLGVKTEEYDGTSFTAGGDLNTYRYTLGGAGSQTAGLGFGGYVYPPSVSTNATEEYDGSSWTSVNNMADARQAMASFGTQTAAIAATGYPRGSPAVSTTLSYDGTNWTTLSSPANVNTARTGAAASGTQTAGLATGGNTSPYKQTEEWDGSSWTNQNSTASEHRNTINMQLGIQTNALVCSGGPPMTTSTEGYDGTTWSSRPNMATARYEAAAGGSATSGFVAGGYDSSSNLSATEEFTGETSTVNIKNFTTS